MTTSARAVGSFPSPFEISTPPGCEGWGGAVPALRPLRGGAHASPTRRGSGSGTRCTSLCRCRRSTCPPSTGPTTPWRLADPRVRVPPAMGIDYRVVNGYVYISVNGVTDPAQIAERAEFFQKRAGHYFENWDALYAEWRTRMEALIARSRGASRSRSCPSTRPTTSSSATRTRATWSARRLPPRAELRRADVAAPLRVPAARLRRLPDVLGLLQGAPPDIPDQHISQMIAGIDVLLFRPDAELRRLARLAVDTGVDGAFVDGRRRPRSTPSSRRATRGAAGSRSSRQIKDPWFNMATGDGLYHYFRSWHDDPTIPYASINGPHRRAARGRDVERPTEELEAERDRLAEGYARPARRRAARAVPGAAHAVAHRLPVRRGAQVLRRLLVPDPLLQQDPRVRRAARRARLARGREDIFLLSRHEDDEALEELC